MIRLSLLYLFIVAALILSSRDWFYGCCAMIILTVFGQHPSMPTRMFGVPGLNPWNAAFLGLVFFWLIRGRRNDAPRSPAPPWLAAMVLAYVLMILLAGLASVAQVGQLKAWYAEKYGALGLLLDGVINPLKYIILAFIVFDGANSRARIRLGILTAVASCLVYGLMMFKTIGLHVLTIDYQDARRLTDKLIGLFANDMAEVLAFMLWTSPIVLVLFRRRLSKLAWLLVSAAAIPTFIALKSRAGFLAFVATGLVLGLVRWRVILVILPVVVIATGVLVPSVRERVFTGVNDSAGENDWNEISAGRVTNLWPPVLKQIARSPLVGYGRFGIIREDCFMEIYDLEGTVPSHPHSAYLEVLLDAGAVGLLICFTCFAGVAWVSWRLLRMRQDPMLVCLGTTALAALATRLTAGLTGSSFFPDQSMVPLLVVWAVALRAYLERGRLMAARVPRVRRRRQPKAVARRPRTPAIPVGSPQEAIVDET